MDRAETRKPGRQRHPLTTADREKRKVALSSVLAALALTATKLVVGLTTHSLGILSEALHSGFDLLAAGLTFLAVRVSGRPPDPEHQYGHGKVENLSALVQTFLLLLTCLGIVVEAVERLLVKHHTVDANHWAFLVVALSLVVDWSRSRALLRVARKHASPALEADAIHFSTDLWSSGVVLFGLVLVRLAEPLGLPWLERADPIAALFVAGIVVKVGWHLGRRNIDELLDRVNPALREQVAAAALVPGVREVLRVRMRHAGAAAFVELAVAVDRGTGLERAHDIAAAAEDAVRAILPRADVVVHVEPVPGEEEGILDLIRVLARREGFTAHDIRIHEVGKRHSVDLHLEAAEPLSLIEADRRARAFEAALRESMYDLESLSTHLEPGAEGTGRPRQAPPAAEERVGRALELVQGELETHVAPHALRVTIIDHRLSVSFHCVLPAVTSLEEAHRVTEEIEGRLRLRLPEVGWVTIRVEPPGGPCPEEGNGRTTPQLP